MCAAYVECPLTAALQMGSILVMTVRWCGEFAAMRFICSASPSGCQLKPSSGAPSADAHGNSSLQQQLQQLCRHLASQVQHALHVSAAAALQHTAVGQAAAG